MPRRAKTYNTDEIGGFHATTVPGANRTPVSLETGKLDPGWTVAPDPGTLLLGGSAWGGYDKICDLAIPATRSSLDIVGLHPEDDMYIIEIDLKCGNTGALFLRPNGDSTGANYEMRVTGDSAGGVVTWTDLTTPPGLPLGSTYLGEEICIRGTFAVASNKVRRYMGYEGRGSSSTYHRVRHRVGHWTDSTTDIDYLTLTGTVSNMLAKDTRVRVYRPTLFRKNDYAAAQFYEQAPQGCYRGLFRGELLFPADGTRALRSYPALSRHANHWRIDVYRDGELHTVHDNWDTVETRGVQAYVHIPNGSYTWSEIETSPVVPGVARSTWQAHGWGYPTYESAANKEMFDIIICGQSMLTMYALNPDLSGGVAEFGIKTSMFFRWVHQIPPNNINYHMSGRWDATNQILENSTIPTSVYADTDADNWRMGPFGVFVYDDGNDTVCQGIPVDIEPLS